MNKFRSPSANLILIGLLLISGILILSYKYGYKRLTDTVNIRAFPTLDLSRIRKIELVSESRKVTVQKNDQSWDFTGEKTGSASADYINQSLESIKNLVLGDVVSEKEERFIDYGIDGKSLTIKIYGDNSNLFADLTIGKYGPDWESTYIKRGIEKKIYLTPFNLQTSFTELLK